MQGLLYMYTCSILNCSVELFILFYLHDCIILFFTEQNKPLVCTIQFTQGQNSNQVLLFQSRQVASNFEVIVNNKMYYSEQARKGFRFAFLMLLILHHYIVERTFSKSHFCYGNVTKNSWINFWLQFYCLIAIVKLRNVKK